LPISIAVLSLFALGSKLEEATGRNGSHITFSSLGTWNKLSGSINLIFPLLLPLLAKTRLMQTNTAQKQTLPLTAEVRQQRHK